MFHIAVCDDEEYFRIREKKLIEEYMKNGHFLCGGGRSEGILQIRQDG